MCIIQTVHFARPIYDPEITSIQTTEKDECGQCDTKQSNYRFGLIAFRCVVLWDGLQITRNQVIPQNLLSRTTWTRFQLDSEWTKEVTAFGLQYCAFVFFPANCFRRGKKRTHYIRRIKVSTVNYIFF